MDRFFVIFHDYDCGDPLGTALTSKSELVADIANGMHEDIQAIFECHLDAKPERIDEEVAELVRAHLASNQLLPTWEVAGWLHEQGVMVRVAE